MNFSYKNAGSAAVAATLCTYVENRNRKKYSIDKFFRAVWGLNICALRSEWLPSLPGCLAVCRRLMWLHWLFFSKSINIAIKCDNAASLLSNFRADDFLTDIHRISWEFQ